MSWTRRHWLQNTLTWGAQATVWGGLTGCAPEPAHFDGGWVGAQVERGHRFRDSVTATKSGALPAAASTHRAAVLIVGAGVSGLACARALMQSGVDDVHVLDLEDSPGGNSRGHRMGGMACPLGAHYLPPPDERNPELLEWLHELGLCQQVQGRWVFDERHLCHSPQERVYMPVTGGSRAHATGHWFDGLLPPIEALPGDQQVPTQAQYERFAALVQAQPTGAFTIPNARAQFSPALQALDAQTFSEWLDQHGLTAPALRWYLDYCCRDDYGAGAEVVSAWAGLHYFASRHGFHAPSTGGTALNSDEHAVLTWPEGNAWLTQRLAAPLRDGTDGPQARWHGGRVALQVEENRFDVSVQVWNVQTRQLERWSTPQLVLATPLFITERLLRNPTPAQQDALRTVNAAMPHAPWLVANVQLKAALKDKPGAAPSWDNVIYGSTALGYVDAMHQSTLPYAGPTVLTSYWALGGQSAGELQSNRQALMNQPWSHWASRVLADMGPAHPDLMHQVTRIDLMRYGHAMCIPVPGLRSSPALAALAQPMRGSRVHIAHSDLSAYSVLEEAFSHGHRVGLSLTRGR